jgi:hypothetical protein
MGYRLRGVWYAISTLVSANTFCFAKRPSKGFLAHVPVSKPYPLSAEIRVDLSLMLGNSLRGLNGEMRVSRA